MPSAIPITYWICRAGCATDFLISSRTFNTLPRRYDVTLCDTMPATVPPAAAWLKRAAYLLKTPFRHLTVASCDMDVCMPVRPHSTVYLTRAGSGAARIDLLLARRAHRYIVPNTLVKHAGRRRDGRAPVRFSDAHLLPV